MYCSDWIVEARVNRKGEVVASASSIRRRNKEGASPHLSNCKWLLDLYLIYLLQLSNICLDFIHLVVDLGNFRLNNRNLAARLLLLDLYLRSFRLQVLNLTANLLLLAFE